MSALQKKTWGVQQEATKLEPANTLTEGLIISIISMDDYLEAEEQRRGKANAALAARINLTRLRQLMNRPPL